MVQVQSLQSYGVLSVEKADTVVVQVMLCQQEPLLPAQQPAKIISKPAPTAVYPAKPNLRVNKSCWLTQRAFIGWTGTGKAGSVLQLPFCSFPWASLSDAYAFTCQMHL